MPAYEEVHEYYSEMLKLWTNVGEEVTVDAVNRALSNWHAVGVYLTQVQREYDAELFVAEQGLQRNEDVWFNEATAALKAVNTAASFFPSSRAVDAWVTGAHDAERTQLRDSVQTIKAAQHSLSQLRRTHEKYAGVLATLSSNLRTDFMYAGQGTDPLGAGQVGATFPGGARRHQAGRPGVDTDVDFMKNA
jgi:hypothetical protein